MTDPKKEPASSAPGFLPAEQEDALARLLREPSCLVGVGNPLRRDDGVGPWTIGALRAALAGSAVRLVDAQDVPENFVPVIARDACRNVVFIDAVSAAGPPGSIVFGPLAEFGEIESFSTHKLALSFSGKYLEQAGKKVYLLGIVPADLSFGTGFSAPVERAAAAVRDFIRGNAGEAADPAD